LIVQPRSLIMVNIDYAFQERRPRGTGGNFVVLSDARESINRVKKGVFLVRKGSNMTFNIAKIAKIWEKKGKIRQIWSMSKKRSSENFARKEIYPKKVIQKSWVRRKISASPQTRRQVSATDAFHYKSIKLLVGIDYIFAQKSIKRPAIIIKSFVSPFIHYIDAKGQPKKIVKENSEL